MTWWCRQFEQYHLFRRLVLLIEMAMLIYVTQISFKYILYATSLSVPGVEIVMVVGALQAPFIALLGYSFKIYSQHRSKDVKPVEQQT